MQTIKFSSFYSYSKALSKQNFANGKGVYVWGIYSNTQKCITPYYVGQSNNIFNRIKEHINQHAGTYRVFNMHEIEKNQDPDKLLYEVIYNIAWDKSGNEKFRNTKKNFYNVNSLCPRQDHLFKNYTLYENNKEYIEYKYNIKDFRKGDFQSQLLSFYLPPKNLVLNEFAENWRLFFTNFRFSFYELDDIPLENGEQDKKDKQYIKRVKDYIKKLEMNVHNALDQSVSAFKNQLNTNYGLNNGQDRTMFLGSIKKNSQKSLSQNQHSSAQGSQNSLNDKEELEFEIDLSAWKNNIIEKVTSIIQTDPKSCIYI